MKRVMNVSGFGLDVHSDVFVYVCLQYVHARACASAFDYTHEGAFAIACARIRLYACQLCISAMCTFHIVLSDPWMSWQSFCDESCFHVELGFFLLYNGIFFNWQYLCIVFLNRLIDYEWLATCRILQKYTPIFQVISFLHHPFPTDWPVKRFTVGLCVEMIK